MKLLLVTQDFPPRPGGMARYYADWARGMGADCTVATGTWEGRVPGPQGGETLKLLPFDASRTHRPWNLFRAGRELDRFLRETKPEMLVSGNIRPLGPLCVRLARRRRLPLIQAYHGNDLLRTARRWKENPMKARRWNRVVRSADRHVVNSGYTAGLARRLGLPPERIAVVPPEVDTERFRPAAAAGERESLRTGFGWPADACVSLFVGRLVQRKGLEDLLAALGDLPPHVRLVVAGPGEVDSWQAAARERGAASRVRFLGKVSDEDLPLLYRAADLFVGPSRDRETEDDVEGFGIVFLEASASGLPVLATRAGGIPEAVEDGVGGILVPPGDVPALAGAWRELAADADLRRRLGEGGRTGRARTHGPGSSAGKLLRVAEEVRGQFRV